MTRQEAISNIIGEFLAADSQFSCSIADSERTEEKCFEALSALGVTAEEMDGWPRPKDQR